MNKSAKKSRASFPIPDTGLRTRLRTFTVNVLLTRGIVRLVDLDRQFCRLDPLFSECIKAVKARSGRTGEFWYGLIITEHLRSIAAQLDKIGFATWNKNPRGKYPRNRRPQLELLLAGTGWPGEVAK